MYLSCKIYYLSTYYIEKIYARKEDIKFGAITFPAFIM